MGRQLHLCLDEHGCNAVDVALVRCKLVMSEESQVGLRVVCPALDLAALQSKIIMSHLDASTARSSMFCM